MKSIQTKLTVIILIIFAISMAALGGLNYWKAREIITDYVAQDMQKQAVSSAAATGDWLKTRRMELTMLASNPVFGSGNAEAIVPILAAAKKAGEGYDAVVYADASGNSINDAGARINVTDRPYFKPTMSGRTFISDPLISKATGHLTVIIAIPVKTAAGSVSGILFGAVKIEELAEDILKVKLGNTGYAYVMQQNGLVMIHPSKDFAMKFNSMTDPKSPDELKQAATRMAKGETGFLTHKYSGGTKMLAFAPIPGVSWSLGISVPTVEVTGAVSSLNMITLITTLVVLILAGIVIAWFARSIARPIRTLEQAVNVVAAGDLSDTRMGIRSNDEIGRLAMSFKQMVGNVRGLIKQISSNAEHLAASSEQLTASADQSSQATNQVALSIQEVAGGAAKQMSAANDAASIVTEMSAGMKEIAANAASVASQTEAAADKAVNGGTAVDKAVNQMSLIETTVNSSAQVVAKLGERSKEIGQIVDAISGIAGQTNLLALNAAIEAARAGEQGRGFAVVAEEVRKLAEQSEEAAKKISGLIGEIQTETDKAVAAMQQGTQEVKTGAEVVNAAGVSFREIADLVTEVSEEVKGISQAIQEMAQGSQKIVGSVHRIDSLSKKSAGEAQSVSAATEEQLASMDEIATSSRALSTLAQDLQSAVAKFRV